MHSRNMNNMSERQDMRSIETTGLLSNSDDRINVGKRCEDEESMVGAQLWVFALRARNTLSTSKSRALAAK
jgi:hypothetical protein